MSAEMRTLRNLNETSCSYREELDQLPEVDDLSGFYLVFRVRLFSRLKAPGPPP